MHVIDPRSVRDLSPLLLDGQGKLLSKPAAFFKDTTAPERALFGTRHGLYGFITDELVEFLRGFIGERSAIEIGAGHGGLAAALGIPATDSCLQADPTMGQLYASLGQAVVRYGANVDKLDAHEAVDKHRPQVVVASWVTHKYDENRHHAGGNMFGVQEEYILAHCEDYVFIGNESVHKGKSIWELPHTKITPPWLYSRAINGSPDFIACWGKTAVTQLLK